MWKDLVINILAAAVWAGAGAFTYRAWIAYRRTYAQARVKLTYFRVLRFGLQSRGDSPFYVRVHHSQAIAAKEGPQAVYDEVLCLNASFSRLAEVHNSIQITSTGVVDALQILPVVAQDSDNHPHSRDDPKRFTASHSEPTNHLMAAGTLVNGLQSVEDRWFGTTAQHDGQTLVLVADFSSLSISPTTLLFKETAVLREKQIVQGKCWGQFL